MFKMTLVGIFILLMFGCKAVNRNSVLKSDGYQPFLVKAKQGFFESGGEGAFSRIRNKCYGKIIQKIKSVKGYYFGMCIDANASNVFPKDFRLLVRHLGHVSSIKQFENRCFVDQKGKFVDEMTVSFTIGGIVRAAICKPGQPQ